MPTTTPKQEPIVTNGSALSNDAAVCLSTSNNSTNGTHIEQHHDGKSSNVVAPAQAVLAASDSVDTCDTNMLINESVISNGGGMAQKHTSDHSDNNIRDEMAQKYSTNHIDNITLKHSSDLSDNGIGSAPSLKHPSDHSDNSSGYAIAPTYSFDQDHGDNIIKDAFARKHSTDYGYNSGDAMVQKHSSDHSDNSSSLSDIHFESSHKHGPTSNSSTSVRFSEDSDSTLCSSDNGLGTLTNSAQSNSSSNLESPTEGAAGANPTLWLGDDQMLLLPGKSRSEEIDSNSTKSETKLFEGLLSPNGTNILWDEDTDWILLFDNMIRYADRHQRTTRSCGCKGSRTEDETDSKSQHSDNSEKDGSSTINKNAVKRASSAPPVRRGVFTSAKSLPNSTTPKRKPSMKSTSKPMSSGSGAGGADEEMFIKSFEDVPRISIYSAKELESELSKIKDVLGDSSNDWEKRVEMSRRFRSVIVAGGQTYDEFYPYLRLLEHPFQTSVKDLRSQVVREACISIAFLSQQIGSKLDHFSEALLPSLINLIPNSAKIMSTAGIVAIRFIIRYTHVSRLIPIITSHLQSKSKDIRKTCFEFLDQLLVTWPTHPMERHVQTLADAIRRGISDADPEARAFSRKAFWSFADHFRDQADCLLNSLDHSKQRMLHDEVTMSNSSSSSSLTQSGKPYRSTVNHHAGSVENLSLGRTGTLGRRTGISNLPSSKIDNSGIPKPLRSTSAIDLSAVRRSKANFAKSSMASLPRTPAVRRNDTSIHAITSPERVMKPRPRGSQSQPSSRPDSPSSRLSYATYSTLDGKSNRTRNKSGIPIATSREASPTRSSFGLHERRLSGSRTRLTGAGEKYSSLTSPVVPLMAERTLQQSREAEVAVADALRTPARRRYNAFDDQSDESETSSVCSDRSFSSFGRSVDDINEVIHNLHSIHWSDRKEGLQALQAYFRSGRILSHIELKKVTDIFSKIFMDPHTKVFSLFLDTLNELIIVHKNDLSNWLYILMTRLFLKMGNDLLNSVLKKVQNTLELVKESFPLENQFNAIMKFLNDQTQTPNNKCKLVILKYLHSLINEMDPSKFSSSSSEVRVAFMKVISWNVGPKTSDLRKAGEDVLAALFSLNPAEYSNLIDQVPKAYKDSAFQLLHSRYPRSNPDTPRSLGNRTSPCPVMSHIQSPNSGLPWPRSHGGTPQNRSFEYDDTENLNPEEISNSWKKTVSEIEEYKSDDFYDKIIRDSPSSRHNSLQGQYDNIVGLVGRLDLNSSAESSPTKRSPTDYSSTNFPRNEAALFERDPALIDNAIDDHKTIYSIVDELNQSSRNEKKIQALGRLICLTREQSFIISNEDFRVILREVIQTVADTSLPVKTLALNALCELIKTKPDYFQDYVELTLLRILEAQKFTEADVTKMADMCAAVAAVNLPPDQCVRVLNALILSEQMHMTQAAIKMLTKLVEHHPTKIVTNLLPDIMPALLKAYDHIESPVRKAAVFSMVAIHCKVGETMMQPYLSSLNSCKKKLLNVYIKKAQQAQNGGSDSTPGSPGNPPSSSSQ
ncbi:CLIP-associating protein 2 isoform X9 [Parasteatoda tepidariorum]|uniref:CLIP-associating protein 2 isoform X9 n=1 Tax=Parasteatoda tepidariorum TaxID=114398 RepID=UPI0039BC79D0